MHQQHLHADFGPVPNFCSMWVPTLHCGCSFSIALSQKALAGKLQEVYITGVLMFALYKASHKVLGLDVCVFTLWFINLST